VSWAALAKGISSHAQIKADAAQAGETKAPPEARRPDGQLTVHGLGPREVHLFSKGKRGGRASRRKGANAERALVRFLQDKGFAAEKSSRTGYTGHDLTVPLLGFDRRVEVKVRANGFRELYRWLNAADLLIVRSDRREPLVVIPLKLAAEIATVAEGRRDGHEGSIPPLGDAAHGS
jgi:hypothetical protein